MENNSSRNAELGLLNDFSPFIFYFIALFAVRWIGKCPGQVSGSLFSGILLACAFRHLSLFLCLSVF